MAKVVKYADADGYQVVIGFTDATVDPVETLNGIQTQILALPELAQVNDQKAKITAQAESAMNYYNLYKAAVASGNNVQADAYNKLGQAAAAQQAVLEQALAPLMEAYAAAKMALFEANAVYSHPGPGCAPLTDTQYTTLSAQFAALTEHQQLTLAGAIVVDYRDCTYWLKDATSGQWSSAVIATLGVALPAGAILAADLTAAQTQEIADQVETARVAGMSTADKLAEAQTKQAASKSAAAQEYTQEIIAGTDAAMALADSQTAYKTALAAINAKYGTSLN